MPELDIHGKKVKVPAGFGDSGLPNREYFSHSQFAMYQRCHDSMSTAISWGLHSLRVSL